jgi:hypothetical protein
MSDADKIRAGLARLVGSEIEGIDLIGEHTYRVTAVHADGRCNLDPIEERMQSHSYVDQWLGGGEVTTPVVGSLCMVIFRDLKKDRPIITRFQPLRITGGKPVKAELDATDIELAGGGPAVARVGDTVTLAAINIIAPPGTSGGPCTVNTISGAITLTGVITSGSSKVTSG